MRPRFPSSVIVVDANIVVRAALGLRSLPTLRSVEKRRILMTSARARQEVDRRVAIVADLTEQSASAVADIFAIVRIAGAAEYAELVEEAAEALRLAVASRNGSTADAHILALAWTLDADIWSHDRDFAGTDWPSWSSVNLLASLAQEELPI